MCGDSTNQEDIKKLMDGVKADLVFTDPPYGMKKENDGVLNDNLNLKDLLMFNRKWIALSFENLKDNGSWYCWGIDEPLMDIYSEILKPMILENKIIFRNLITWYKGVAQGQLSETHRMYATADEKCLFVMCGVQGFNTNVENYYEGWEPIRTYLRQERDKMGWTNADMKTMCGHSPTSGCHWFDKNQWVMPTEEIYNTWQAHAKKDAFKREYDDIKREYYQTRAYFNNTHDSQTNVWNFTPTTQSEREETGGHPTPKPIALCSRAIKSSSRENEIVLDMFGGSGSTLIACEQLGRACYAMELEPKYIDVIIKRWENLTGQKAVKL
jgi:DNA modification methylase